MSDLPPGKWSPLLVGQYWPSWGSVIATVNAAQNRGLVSSLFDDYASQLLTMRTGPLAPMEGVTARAIHVLFDSGEAHASSVADRNRIKQAAFSAAADSLNGLRSALTQIAAEGNNEIDQIQQSRKNAAQKLAEIVALIARMQEGAASKSAQYSSAIARAVEKILASGGDGRMFDEFAKDTGLDLTPPPNVSEDAIRGPTQLFLASDESTGGTDPTDTEARAGGGSTQLAGGMSSPPDSSPQSTTQDRFDRGATQTIPDAHAVAGVQDSGAMTSFYEQNVMMNPDVAAGTAHGPVPSTPGIPSLGTPSAPSLSAIAGAAGGQAGIPSLPAFATGLPDVGQVLRPDNLMQGFTHGVEAGAPMSAGAQSVSQAISQGVQHAYQPPVAHLPEFSTPTGTLAGATAPMSGGYYATDSHPGGAMSDTHAAVTPTAMASPSVLAAPMSPAATSAAPAVPMAPAGPLPAYGADLRPTAATPPLPSAGSPTSAPFNPSSPAASHSQPTVVNKAPGSTAPTSPSSSRVVESALAATVSGAAAGAAATFSATRARLRHLVEAVARQQPSLSWAIGEQADGSTVLVTDVASGWIPPGIDIPIGVRLLPPSKRRGGLESLLGEATVVETWIPEQYLQPSRDAAEVSVSLRARDLPPVDELAWELTRATNWRDGLPRLAHTLAKAGTSGTGVLEAEADLLRENLRTISDRVLREYPGPVDDVTVGNWQLLAAIDALVREQRTTLNYHFAWFQALHSARHGG